MYIKACRSCSCNIMPLKILQQLVSFVHIKLHLFLGKKPLEKLVMSNVQPCPNTTFVGITKRRSTTVTSFPLVRIVVPSIYYLMYWAPNDIAVCVTQKSG